MKTYFKQIRVSKIITVVNLLLLLFLIGAFLVFALVFYTSLPKHSPIRTKFKLGKILTGLEISHLFYDYRNLGIPVYDLVIDDKKYSEMLTNLPKGSIMTKEFKKYRKARFLYNNKEYKVKVRFRGVGRNHWQDKKKSWRIKFKKDDLFEKKRSIHLIIPQDRGYFSEHLSNYIGRKLGLIVPDSKFVFLRVNGYLQGVYFETEHIGKKEFFERHGRVGKANLYNENHWNHLKYNFIPLYEKTGHWKKKSKDKISKFDNYAEMDYLLFLLNKTEDDRFYREIDNFLDMDYFLKWQSHSMLFGSYHQTNNNMNLYFDNTAGKFFPIPWNLFREKFKTFFIDKPYNPIVTRILKNPKLRNQRNKILWEYVSNKDNFKDDMRFYDETYESTKKAFYVDTNKGILNWKFDNDVKDTRGIIKYNRSKIIDNLEFANLFVNVRMFLDKEKTAKKIVAILDIESHGFSAATLNNISVTFPKKNVRKNNDYFSIYFDKNNNNILDKEDELAGQLKFDIMSKKYIKTGLKKVLYSGRDDSLLPVSKSYRFFLKYSHSIKKGIQIDVTLDALNSVTGKPAKTEIKYIDDRVFRRFNEVALTANEFKDKYPFFKRDKLSSNHFSFPVGEVFIAETIIIPETVTVNIKAGTILKFSPNTSLVSYGKINAIGSSDAPVIITAYDKKKNWGVFSIVGDSADKSSFSNIIVEYGSDAFINGIFFSGAFNAYHASVEIKNSIFRYNAGDDALNVKNADGNVFKNIFYENASDAIDFDYANGEISNNHFYDNYGDNVDLGTSSPLIISNLIESATDKGISVGEASNPVIVNNVIRFCNIGIAPKDSSMPLIINNTIVSNNYGIKSYMKKKIFGGAKTDIINTIIWGNKTESINLDNFSTVTVSYSNIQGGYSGDNNYTIVPEFLDPKSFNYTLSNIKENGKLLKGGSGEYLKDHLAEFNLSQVPVGIISNTITPSLN